VKESYNLMINVLAKSFSWDCFISNKLWSVWCYINYYEKNRKSINDWKNVPKTTTI